MIPIEFYVKFNLTGRVKPNTERKKEETESMFFPVPRQNQCTQLFSAKEKRIPKAIRGVVRRAVLVGMIKEHRGKLLVRSSRYIWGEGDRCVYLGPYFISVKRTRMRNKPRNDAALLNFRC
jgi:Ribonuclease G/E